MLSKIIALFAMAVIGTGLQIMVMIYGWGLQPKNWWWIIGVGLILPPIVKWIAEKIIKEEK